MENIFSEAFNMSFVELSAGSLCSLYVELLGVDMIKRCSYSWTINLSICCCNKFSSLPYIRLIKPRVIRLCFKSMVLDKSFQPLQVSVLIKCCPFTCKHSTNIYWCPRASPTVLEAGGAEMCDRARSPLSWLLHISGGCRK